MKYGILLFLCSVLAFNSYANFDLMLHLSVEITELKEELAETELKNQEFKKALGMRESNMNPRIINPIGAMGVWQFMPGTLRDLGFGHITPGRFRQNPDIFPLELQEEALELKFNRDIHLLTYQWFRGENSINYIETFVGKKIHGIEITLTGLLAASHLAGAGGVIRYLDSFGARNPKDMFGTRLSDYLRQFSEYDYNSTFSLKQQLQCLEDSLKNLKPSTPLFATSRSYTRISDLQLREMEIVLISQYQSRIFPTGTTNHLTIYHSELEFKSPDIIEPSLNLEALPLRITTWPLLMAMVKSNGIMRENGTDLSIVPEPRALLEKVQDYSNFTLSRYGMLPGTFT